MTRVSQSFSLVLLSSSFRRSQDSNPQPPDQLIRYLDVLPLSFWPFNLKSCLQNSDFTLSLKCWTILRFYSKDQFNHCLSYAVSVTASNPQLERFSFCCKFKSHLSTSCVFWCTWLLLFGFIFRIYLKKKKKKKSLEHICINFRSSTCMCFHIRQASSLNVLCSHLKWLKKYACEKKMLISSYRETIG